MKRVMPQLLAVILIGVIFSGCSTSSLKVNQSFEELVSDKHNAYVVFVRPYSFMGGAHNIDIMEFDEHTFKPKAVIHLDKDERTVYAVKPGKSYFFTNVGANENITMVDLKPGEIEFINMGVTGNTVFAPIHLAKSRMKLRENLLTKPCSDILLRRYLFDSVIDENDENNFGDKKNDREYSSPMQFTLSCDNEKILDIKDNFHGVTMKEINGFTLVEPNKGYINEIEKRNEEFKSDIKTLYPVWDLKLKSMPLSEDPVVFLIKEPTEKQRNQYTNVVTEVRKLNEKVSVKAHNGFIEESSQLFKTYTDNKKTLKLVYEINNFDDGSMAGRYFTTGFSAAGAYKDIGVLDVTVKIMDEKENLIGIVRLTTMEAFGLLGGINTMTSDILEIVEKYVINNYMKTIR